MLKLTPREQKLVLLLCILLILGFILRFTLPEPGSVEIKKNGEEEGALESSSGSNLADPGNSTLIEENQVVVHVSGAVSKPGVYTLPEGARVIQALEMAGGPLKEADLEGINLAQPLYDGQQARIPFKPNAAEVGMDSAREIQAYMHPDGKININLADQAQLESLPGIGSVKSQSIIHYREQNGPFRQIEDLVKVSGIGDKTLENIKDLITVY